MPAGSVSCSPGRRPRGGASGAVGTSRCHAPVLPAVVRQLENIALAVPPQLAPASPRACRSCSATACGARFMGYVEPPPEAPRRLDPPRSAARSAPSRAVRETCREERTSRAGAAVRASPRLSTPQPSPRPGARARTRPRSQIEGRLAGDAEASAFFRSNPACHPAQVRGIGGSVGGTRACSRRAARCAGSVQHGRVTRRREARVH